MSASCVGVLRISYVGRLRNVRNFSQRFFPLSNFKKRYSQHLQRLFSVCHPKILESRAGRPDGLTLVSWSPWRSGVTMVVAWLGPNLVSFVERS